VKIAILNNYFYIRGGSERVFHDEMNMLKDHNHQVAAFCRSHNLDPQYEFSEFFPYLLETEKFGLSSESIKTATEIVYSWHARRKLSLFLDAWNADLGHLHNIYGRLSTSVIDELWKRKIPAVLSLHDYKLICPSYKLTKAGGVCEDCKGFKFYYAIKNKCHKNSSLASGLYALESYFNYFRKCYLNKISFLISPSDFLRNKFIEFGWNPEQIKTVPNFINSDLLRPNFDKGDYFLYIGRISREKGVATLLKSFSGLPSDARLLIAGTGPLENELKKKNANHPGISFIGYLTGEKLSSAIRNARAVVVPSEWYENSPMSILEAMAYGKPVIGARIGGIPEMIHDNETGCLFRSGSVEELTEKLLYVNTLSNQKIQQMGYSARSFVQEKHSPRSHYDKLSFVYRSAIKKAN
jgi:glycosyltransferase involved in cell wall biosynthesis